MLLAPSAFAFKQVDFDLSKLDEDSHLGPRKSARLLALADKECSFDENKVPLILVHGIRGNPVDLQGVVDRMKCTDYQIFVLAYADYKKHTSTNGYEFSREIMKIKNSEATIVAHSMGGLVARKAINDLIREDEISRFTKLKIYTIDTPWHGFDGPPDNSRMRLVRPFMPDGLEDMRANSDFFKELVSVKFPANVSLEIAFAEEGDEAKDYTEELTDPVQRSHFINALELTGKYSEDGDIPMEVVFPRFPGNHVSVIKENGSAGNYLDYIEDKLKTELNLHGQERDSQNVLSFRQVSRRSI